MGLAEAMTPTVEVESREDARAWTALGEHLAFWDAEAVAEGSGDESKSKSKRRRGRGMEMGRVAAAAPAVVVAAVAGVVAAVVGAVAGGPVAGTRGQWAATVAWARSVGYARGTNDDALARLFAVRPSASGALAVAAMRLLAWALGSRAAWVDAFVSARTRFMDAVTRNSSASQVVVVGAASASDTRAFRGLTKATTRFFEVDSAAGLKAKEQVLRANANELSDIDAVLPGTPLRRVEFLEAGDVPELAASLISKGPMSFLDTLKKSGFYLDNPNTVVLLEGALARLDSDQAVRALLYDLSRLRVGTCVVLDVVERAALDEAKSSSSLWGPWSFLRLATRLAQKQGEEWRWGLPTGVTCAEFFIPKGFDVLLDLDASDIRRRFYPTSPSFLVPVEGMHLVLLCVNGRRFD